MAKCHDKLKVELQKEFDLSEKKTIFILVILFFLGSVISDVGFTVQSFFCHNYSLLRAVISCVAQELSKLFMEVETLGEDKFSNYFCIWRVILNSRILLFVSKKSPHLVFVQF